MANLKQVLSRIFSKTHLNKYAGLFFLVVILVLSAYLRFVNLGYSEFQDDEKKAFMKIYQGGDLSTRLLEFRKGPAQFFVAYIPYLVTRDYRNEFASRLPFAIANLMSVVVFYIYIRRLFKNRFIALVAAFLFAVNGLIVAFSRILQYQSLNLLFSLTALIFFDNLSHASSFKNSLRNGLFGIFLTVLSFYSHWDAIFYFIPSLFFVVRFLRRPDLVKKQKIQIITLMTCVFLLALLPFFIPYVMRQMASAESQAYFARRIGLFGASLFAHKTIFELYNPFFVLPLFLGSLIVFTLFFIFHLLKKSNRFEELMVFVWFVFNFLVMKFLWVKPGTHIYNYLIPLFIIIALALFNVLSLFPRILRPLLFLPFAVLGAFYFYQSYVLFVDNNKEYPWEAKQVWKYTTTPYTGAEVITFGFPHFRNLKEINNIISNDPDKCTYISNEGKNITQAYIDANYGLKDNTCYYILEVRRPFIIVNDNAKFAVSQNKVVYKYSHDGETLVKLYKVIPKPPKTITQTN